MERSNEKKKVDPSALVTEHLSTNLQQDLRLDFSAIKMNLKMQVIFNYT